MTDTVAATGPTMPAHSDRERWLAVIALCAGFLMIVLDATVVNVALPSIQEDLEFSQSNLAWVVNAYLIAFGGLLLLAGRLGDLIGRKRVFLSGLWLFVGASVLCGVSQSQEMLIGARFLQGIGGAMTSAVILGMIVTMFSDPRQQGKAIGVYSFVAAGGASIGLLAGGVLTEAINWHWIFFVNVPIGIATGISAMRLIEHEDGIGLDKGADVPGAVLITSSLMLLVYTIVQAAENDWGSTRTVVLGLIAIALLVGFVIRESSARQPLIPLGIFRSRQVSGANIVQVLMVAGMFGMFFLGALYMQQVLGYSPLEVGLAFLPGALLIGVLSITLAPKAVMTHGPRNVLVFGLVLAAISLGLFARVPLDGNYLVDLLPVMVLLGVGMGLCFTAVMTIAMSGATDADAGLSSGLVNTTQQIGGALGLAVLATLSTTRTDSLREQGEPLNSALLSGFHLAFVIATGLVIAALVVAIAVLQRAHGHHHAHAAEEAHGAPQPAFDEAG